MNATLTHTVNDIVLLNINIIRVKGTVCLLTKLKKVNSVTEINQANYGKKACGYNQLPLIR